MKVKARTQGSIPVAGAEAEPMEKCSSLVCSQNLFQLPPRTTCLEVALPIVGWAPLHESVKKMPHRLAVGSSDEGIFLVEVPSSQVIFSLCQVG